MSWVLILNSSYNSAMPAVIGGYASWKEAVEAGEFATAFSKERFGPLPYYRRFLVTPGAGCSVPGMSIESTIDRNDDGFAFRVTRINGVSV